MCIRDSRSTGHRSGIGEVEQRRARIFEQLGFRHELRRHFRRCLRARRRLRAVGDAVLQGGLRGDAELREDRDACTHEGAHRVGEIGGAVELDHVRAAFLHQSDRSLESALGTLLQRPEREIAAHQRALDAAAHRFADDQHLVHGDLERIAVAPQIHADGIAHRYEIDAGAIRDARDLVIPRHHAHALFAFALHLLKGRDRHFVRHDACCSSMSVRGLMPRWRRVVFGFRWQVRTRAIAA